MFYHDPQALRYRCERRRSNRLRWLHPRTLMHSTLVLSAVNTVVLQSLRVFFRSRPSKGTDISRWDCHSQHRVYQRIPSLGTGHDQRTHLRLIAVLFSPTGQIHLIGRRRALGHQKNQTRNHHDFALACHPLLCHDRSMQRDVRLPNDPATNLYLHARHSTQ